MVVVGVQLVDVDVEIDEVVPVQEVTVPGGGHVVGVTVTGLHVVPTVGHDSHV